MKKTSDNGTAGVLHIEAARENGSLKISAYEQMNGLTGTVRRYEEFPAPMDAVERRCREIAETLNTANRRGKIAPDILTRLKEIGQVLSDDLLTHTVKEKIRTSNAGHLVAHLDDGLVHVPWELLHDGDQFLCQRFAMGRLVRTRQNVPAAPNRDLKRPVNMMILADPQGDLNEAYTEGIQLRDHLDGDKDFVRVALRTSSVTSDFVREKMRQFDIVHFAGHADYDSEHPEKSGWRLTDRRLRLRDVMKMAGTDAMPALVFSNACQSARTEAWSISGNFHDEIFGMANAFILSGVRHYLGTFWEIPDEPGRRFALEFYKHLLAGESAGRAVQQARTALIQDYGEETIVWASYLLYGDPAFNYLNRVKTVRANKKPVVARTMPEAKKTRSPEHVIDFSAEKRAPKNRRRPAAIAILAILALIAVFFGRHPETDTREIENRAMSFYQAGNYAEALDLFGQVLEHVPEDRALAAMIGETREKLSISLDREKQEEIARLVESLEKRAAKPRKKRKPADDWTSAPLTLWITDLTVQGQKAGAGEEILVPAGMADMFLSHGRVKPVERAMLDSVLRELKLGTSGLADKDAAPVLGRLLAAKLIITGRIILGAHEKTVSLRLIETETGSITATVNESFPEDMRAFEMAETLSKAFLDQIEKTYPLQGKVLETRDGKAVLNIGQKAGVETGRRFGVMYSGVVLETVSTEPETSLAKIVVGNDITQGARVKAIFGSKSQMTNDK